MNTRSTTSGSLFTRPLRLSNLRGVGTLLGFGISVTALCFAVPGCGAAEAPEQTEEASQAVSAPGRYLVQFSNVKEGHAALRSAGGRVALDLPRLDAAAALMSESAAAALAQNPHVASVERDVERYALAETVPYGIPLVQGDQLSDAGAGNTTVCIIDSGVFADHEDLPASKFTASPDVGTGDPLSDACGHGTHVAGTIAAVGNSTGVVGLNPSEALNVHIVKVFGDNCAWAYSSTLMAALQACIDDAPAGTNLVVNMSLGGPIQSLLERQAFANAAAQGVLSIAAAGNDGSTRKSYPASYPSVVSVAAVDSNKTLASFSQRNNEVDLAAPGVSVLSTMMPGAVSYSPAPSVEVGAQGVEATVMTGSPQGTGTGPLVSCGLGDSVCAASGGVCLIERGSVSFAEKVLNCQAGGGTAAIIYNNEAGPLNGTLNGTVTTIPSVGITQADGQTLLGLLGSPASVGLDATSPYVVLNGTSMATPHVAGGAALLWSQFPDLANTDIRDALITTAEDLGVAGRDDSYGNGLIQLYDAFSFLGGTAGCSSDEECNDGDACNGVESCVGGGCVAVPPPDCNDENLCTADSCDPALGCVNDPVDAGTSCGNETVCDGSETCDGAGSCTPGAPLTCEPDQTCDPTQGCIDPECTPALMRCQSSDECCSGSCVVTRRGRRCAP